MMEILITGFNGFTAFHMAEFYAKNGNNVYVCVRNPKHLTANSSSLLSLWPNIRLVNSFDIDFRIDIVIHCAAYSPEFDKIANVDRLIEDNVIYTQQIVKVAKKSRCTKFVYMSSNSVYGKKVGQIKENYCPVNPDFYGITKFVGEKIIFSEASFTTAVALRLPAIIGLGSSRNWISRLTRQLLDGERIEVYNSRNSYNNLIYIDDLIAIVDELISSNGEPIKEIFNVAAMGKLDIINVIEVLKNGLKSQSEVVLSKAMKSKGYTIDNSKLVDLMKNSLMDVEQSLLTYVTKIYEE